MSDVVDAKATRLVVRFLAQGAATPQAAAAKDIVLLDGGARGVVSTTTNVIKALAAAGLLERQANSIALSEAGRAYMLRMAADRNPLQDQHRDLTVMAMEMSDGTGFAQVNLSESPLGQLVRRKGKDGQPFLDPAEWRAGERLRADYTRGQIMPRMGANWVASVSSGRRASGGGIAELTDAALAARLRVDRAIAAVGPELAGVLIDVCCFLKGLERVEAERGWPVRSAKIVLKTALAALARHYDPQGGTRKRSSGAIVHWGADDFRPSLG